MKWWLCPSREFLLLNYFNVPELVWNYLHKLANEATTLHTLNYHPISCSLNYKHLYTFCFYLAKNTICKINNSSCLNSSIHNIQTQRLWPDDLRLNEESTKILSSTNKYVSLLLFITIYHKNLFHLVPKKLTSVIDSLDKIAIENN